MSKTRVCCASVLPAVMPQLQVGGAGGAPHIWKSLQVSQPLQAGGGARGSANLQMYKPHCAGGNWKRSCCSSVSTTAVGLRHVGLGTKSQTRKSPLAVRAGCSYSAAEPTVPALCS